VKKIIIVGNSLFSLRSFRGPLLLELNSRSKLICVAPDRDPSVEGWLASKGIQFCQVPFTRSGMNPLAALVLTLQLWRLFRRERPSHVLSYTLKPVLFGSVAARLAGVPHVSAMLSGLGFLFTGDRARSFVSRLTAWGLRSQLRKIQNVFFQNPDDKMEFSSLGIIDERNTVVVLDGSGVPLDAFPKQDLPQGAPVFLMVARFLRDKGFVEFCEAANELRSRWPETRFAVLGTPDLDNPAGLSLVECEDLLAKGGVENWGWSENVREQLARCHVFVLPSYREGTPRSALEAMSTGRALVVSDVPGCREVLREGLNGFFCQARDAASLAHAMEFFLKDPSLISQMGAQSRVYAEERFDVRKVNAMIIKSLEIESR